MSSFSPITTTVWKDVDILVIGGTCAAVAAALEANAAGRRVALLADGTYLGTDLAGACQLWPGGNDPLISEAFSSCSENPARPAALKRALEKRLLEARIPFLFGVRPVGLLRGKSGELQGAVFAARTALFAVMAPCVIDATTYGLAARLASAKTVSRPSPSPVRWRVLASQEPSSWAGSIRELKPAYHQHLKDGPKEYRAYELEIERNELCDGPLAMEHAARSRLLDEHVWVTADHLIDCGGLSLQATREAATVHDLEDGNLQLSEGLWLANRLLAVADAGSLSDPSQMVSVGRRVGRLAARQNYKTGPGPCTLQTGGSGVSGISFTGVFLRAGSGGIILDNPEFPVWESFDVLVAGGGTGGAPAAIASARAGAKTLCLETGHGLGGVGTLGLISSYWFGNKCGFTAELTDLMCEADEISRAKKGNSWHPGVKSAMYHRLLRDAGGTAWMGSSVCGVLRRGNRPEGVLVTTPHGCGFVPAKSFVDATGNADLAAAAGARCRLMDRHHAAVQGTGISPRVHPSVAHQNSDHTFIEENDPEGITMAHVQAREKYPNDFETMPFVNSRERRQIVGDFEVSPLDILTERTFPDTVFTAKSNFDTHGFIIHPVFMVSPPDHAPLHAHVPLRCMLPQGLEGVLVTGLGMSAHRDALPVIRMQADVQNQGYAAGLLAARCARSGETFRAVDEKAFQRELVKAGILDEATAAQVDSFPLAPEAIAAAAAGDLSPAKDVAILFAHPEISKPLLKKIVASSDPVKRRAAALILGLMGDSEAGPALLEWVSTSTWDEGWNYRGMGQFGRSMSQLDAAIIALGRARCAEAAPALAKLASTLHADAAFSHCRALALATASLKDPVLTGSLKRLLDLPGFSGHAFQGPQDILADNDPEPTSTSSRNLSLREIYVARGVFLAGDSDPSIRGILESYSKDLRGHFARHACAILETSDSSQDNILLA